MFLSPKLQFRGVRALTESSDKPELSVRKGKTDLVWGGVVDTSALLDRDPGNNGSWIPVSLSGTGTMI